MGILVTVVERVRRVRRGTVARRSAAGRDCGAAKQLESGLHSYTSCDGMLTYVVDFQAVEGETRFARKVGIPSQDPSGEVRWKSSEKRSGGASISDGDVARALAWLVDRTEEESLFWRTGRVPTWFKV